MPDILNLTPQLPVVFLLSAVIFLISFIRTDFALIILIFSMLLSPELPLANIPGREVVLRVEDVFLFVVFFGWLAKMAINKEMGLLRNTPINRPILAYIFICLLSSSLGVLQGTTKPQESIFYLLKYVEYFIIFFMVSNNIRNEHQVKTFIFFMLLTCFIVSIYAISTYSAYGGRASTPFEGEGGEPNTLAGYLLIIMGMILGLFLYSHSPRLQFFLGGFLIFTAVVFLFTLSRGGWIGFVPMYLTFLILSKRKKAILLLIFILIISSAPFIFPKKVIHRVQTTFMAGTTYTIFGRQITLDESASARVRSVQGSLSSWSKYPILGRGVPGGGVVSDVQYTRVLREVGIIGFLAFIWIITRLFKLGLSNFNHPQLNDFGKGLSLGFLAALAGIIFMGVSAEVFIIVRIMEPFWFLAALVVMLPEVSLNSKEETER